MYSTLPLTIIIRTRVEHTKSFIGESKCSFEVVVNTVALPLAIAVVGAEVGALFKPRNPDVPLENTQLELEIFHRSLECCTATSWYTSVLCTDLSR